MSISWRMNPILTAPTYCLYYWTRLAHGRNNQYVPGLETLSITPVLSHHSLVITSSFVMCLQGVLSSAAFSMQEFEKLRRTDNT